MSRTEVSIIELDPSVKPLLGSMCWKVWFGLTNLSMELGEPILRVLNEPVPNIRVRRKEKHIPIAEVRRCANRRRIAVTGHWSLWIYDSYWRIVRSGVCLATGNSSMRKMGPALLDLQGQRITGMNVNPENGATRLEFDLDTVVEVRRKQRCSKAELWLLNGLDGHERSVRGDGSFNREKRS